MSGVIGFALAVVLGLAAFGVHAAVAGPSAASGPTLSTGNKPAAPSALPMAGASHAGKLVLSDTGAALKAWGSPSTCTANGYQPDGDLSTDGDSIVMRTTGNQNSCVALASPGTYSSDVIEAEIDLPAYPGRPDAVANWDALWLTNAAVWPHDGELDAVETEPPTGVNGVSWHSGTGSDTASFNVSTHSKTLPADGANISPGWHTVDIVYTKGYFAVYYDGSMYTSFTSSQVTGAPLTLYFTTDVYPSADNSDSSPASVAMKYLKVWSYK